MNYTEQGISSRVLAKNGGGNITLFAFDKGRALSEHSAPFDAIVMIAEGSLILTIAGKPVTTKPGYCPYAGQYSSCCGRTGAGKMLLVMLREPENKQD